MLKTSCDCFCSTQIGTPGKTVGTMFAPVDTEVVSYEPEKVGGKSFNIVTYNTIWTCEYA